jgi:hypothetical protein
MNDPRTLARLVVLGTVLAWSGTAAAGTASFGIPGGGGMVGDTGATISAGGVFLPNTSAPRALFTIVLPRDYVKNTPIKLITYFHSIATNCSFVLLPAMVVHRRPGLPVDGTTTILAPQDGSPVVDAPSSPSIPGQKTFVLSPGGATISNIKRGDQFLIGLARDTADLDDNCENLVVLEAVDVRYTTP